MSHRLINMWSGPRNLSTAMMYSWRQRSDTTVWDEPMYGHFLVVSGIDHPGRDETIATSLTDTDELLAEMLHGACPTPIRFYKNMAHHLVGLDLTLVDELENFLLTRDPRHMLPSLARGLQRVPTMSDTGFADQNAIVDRILASGRRPIVVDSHQVLVDPMSVLRQLCGALEVPWEESMLSWPAGPKPEDGVWAPYWYERLHATTGFEPHLPKETDLSAELESIYNECVPLYERLTDYSINE